MYVGTKVALKELGDSRYNIFKFFKEGVFLYVWLINKYLTFIIEFFFDM